MESFIIYWYLQNVSLFDILYMGSCGKHPLNKKERNVLMKEKRQFQNRLISLALPRLFVLLPTNSLMTTAQFFSGQLLFEFGFSAEDSTFVLSNCSNRDDYNPEMHIMMKLKHFQAVRVTANTKWYPYPEMVESGIRECFWLRFW